MPGRAADTITVIHYNDVYNVESRETEPVGGAARFATAVGTYADLDPLILFSGDIFAPSISKLLSCDQRVAKISQPHRRPLLPGPSHGSKR